MDSFYYLIFFLFLFYSESNHCSQKERKKFVVFILFLYFSLKNRRITRIWIANPRKKDCFFKKPNREFFLLFRFFIKRLLLSRNFSRFLFSIIFITFPSIFLFFFLYVYPVFVSIIFVFFFSIFFFFFFFFYFYLAIFPNIFIVIFLVFLYFYNQFSFYLDWVESVVCSAARFAFSANSHNYE